MKFAIESVLVGVSAVLICARSSLAADLHPIVEVQSGYFFGAISDGKWIKADEAAKSISEHTTYRVYGLTQALGEAKAGKPKVVPDSAPRSGDSQAELCYGDV